MFNSLRENAQENMTKPQLAELEDMLNRANRDPKELVAEAMADKLVEEDEDLIDDLI